MSSQLAVLSDAPVRMRCLREHSGQHRLPPQEAAALVAATTLPGQKPLQAQHFVTRLTWQNRYAHYRFRTASGVQHWTSVTIGIALDDAKHWERIQRLPCCDRFGSNLNRTLWADHTRHCIWQGPSDAKAAWRQGSRRESIPRLFHADDLLQRFKDSPLSELARARLRRALALLADRLNMAVLAQLTLPKSVSTLLATLGRTLPDGPVQMRGAQLLCAEAIEHAWAQDDVYRTVAQESPNLLTTMFCVNAALPPERRLRSAQSLLHWLDAHRAAHARNLPVHPWRALVKYGHHLLRPYLQTDCKRAAGTSWVVTALRNQVLMGDGRLPPPWFMRGLIALHQRPDIPALGAGGWTQLSPTVFKAAASRALQRSAPQSRQKLMEDVAVLVAVGQLPTLEAALQQGGWAALIACAKAHLAHSAASTQQLLDSLRVVTLTTPEDLDDESRHMAHCIGDDGYDDDLQLPNTRFISLRSSDGRMRFATATLIVAPQDDGGYGWCVEDIYGLKNAEVSKSLRLAAEAYASALPLTAECLVDYWSDVANDIAYWTTMDRRGRPAQSVVVRRLMQAIDLAHADGRVGLARDARVALDLATATPDEQTAAWLAAIIAGKLDPYHAPLDGQQRLAVLRRITEAKVTHPEAAEQAAAYIGKAWAPWVQQAIAEARQAG